MSDAMHHHGKGGPGGERPTRARFVVLGFLCLLAAVLYLDRICISAALDSIQADLKLTNTQTSYVLMAFTVAYGLFEIPTGRWGDVLGSRRILTRISLWWSAFTALTGACTGLWSLIAVRFLFGAGEAGAYPNTARVIARWFPESERGRAQGILLAASLVGGALAPALATFLILKIGWRWSFVFFGILGALWAAGFWWWFRDDPANHPAVNEAEAREIGRRDPAGGSHPPIPWPAVLRNASIRSLSIIMASVSFNSYIYFSWYPKYLKAGRGITASEAALMASMVLGMAAVGTFAGGQMFDRWVRPLGHSGRRFLGGGACFSAACLLGCALFTQQPWVAAGFTAVSCFCTQATQPLWWSCAIGISGRHVGALFGLMNAVGVFGAISSQFLVGAIADWLGARGFTGRTQWDPIFYIDIAVLIFAACMWSTFRFVVVEKPETGGKPSRS